MSDIKISFINNENGNETKNQLYLSIVSYHQNYYLAFNY